MMHLFAGSTHPALAQNLADELGISLGDIEIKRFSCGEGYVRFRQSIRGQEVYLLQAPGRDPDKDLFELFLMCQAAKLSFASSIHVILPQFPYARQDRVSKPREPISAKLVAHLLEEAGADHLITLSLHSDQIQGFFSIPVDAHALDPRPLFADYFRQKELKDPVVVSPDIGGAKRAKKFADLLGADLAIMHKTRPEQQVAEVIEVVGDVHNRHCILFDDLIDTGGSLIGAKEALQKHGAHQDVYAAASHAVLSGDAPKTLETAGFTEVVVTDSIPPLSSPPPNLTSLPIAPLLAEVIHHIERRESVTNVS